MPVHIYTSRALEGSHREHPYIRRYAPSSRFRFDRRDRNAYIPPRKRERKRGRKGESAMARSEGSTQGSVGSIAPTLARVRSRARARSADTCVHTRLASSCARRRVRASILSRPFVVYPVGVDVIPIYSVPSPFVVLLLLLFPRHPHPRPPGSSSLFRFATTRGYRSRYMRVTPLRLPTFVRSLVAVGPSRFYLRVRAAAETFALYPESTGPDRISFWLRISTLRIHARMLSWGLSDERLLKVKLGH